MHDKPQELDYNSFNFGESQINNENDRGYDLDEAMHSYPVSSRSTGSRPAAGMMMYDTP